MQYQWSRMLTRIIENFTDIKWNTLKQLDNTRFLEENKENVALIFSILEQFQHNSKFKGFDSINSKIKSYLV